MENGSKELSEDLVCTASAGSLVDVAISGGDAQTAEWTRDNPRPVWVADEASDTCQQCDAEFHLFLRRHHCRGCGALLCDTCTSERGAFPKMGYATLERCCRPCARKSRDDCFHQLLKWTSFSDLCTSHGSFSNPRKLSPEKNDMTQQRRLVEVGIERERAILDVLKNAFYDDPVCAFLLPHPDNPKLVDPRFLEVFFTLVLRLAAKLDDGLTLAFDESDDAPHGHTHGSDAPVYEGDNRVRAASIWFPPGESIGELDLLFRSEIWEYRSLLSFSMLGRLFKVMKVMDHHDVIMGKRPHYYLSVIGTRIDCQGKGYGSQLMRNITNKADDLDVECYLESSKEDNVPFYQKHGFEVEETAVVENGPTLWLMRRERRSLRNKE